MIEVLGLNHQSRPMTMSNASEIPQRPHFETEEEAVAAVLDKLREITSAASSGRIVFRGEPKYYDEISSGLYREFKARLGTVGIEGFDLDEVQTEILEDAERYVGEIHPADLLSQLQHFGHPTNMIDFTKDFLIAVFFACNGEPEEDGRIIIMDVDTTPIVRLQTPQNRIKSQKSVFVTPPTGVIAPDRVVHIPAQLKHPLIAYLNNLHDINAHTIYDDIHGYIKNAKIHRSAYAHFHIGKLLMSRDRIDEAVEHFSDSIELNGEQESTHGNRGSAHMILGNFEDAITDYTRVIELNPDDAKAYSYRGFAYLLVENPVFAERDLSEAIRLDPTLVDAYESRATARAQRDDYHGMIDDLGIVIQMEPSRVSAYVGRSVGLRFTDDNIAALQDLDKAIELDPSITNAYRNRAYTRFNLRNYSGAISDWETYVDLSGEESATVHFHKALSYVAMSNFERARDELNRAIAIDDHVANGVVVAGFTAGHLISSLEFGFEVPIDILDMLDPKIEDASPSQNSDDV